MICRNFINLELFVTSGHSTRRRNKCPQPTRENYRLKCHHRSVDLMGLGGVPASRVCTSSPPNCPGKNQAPPWTGATFPAPASRWACLLTVGRRGDSPAGHSRWKMLLIGLPTLALSHLATFRPTECQRRGQRRKLNETRIGYRFLLRAVFLPSLTRLAS